MLRLVFILPILWLAGITTPVARAAESVLHAGTGAAGDLIMEGDAAFSRGDYAAAAASYQKFLSDFGQSAEAKPKIEPLLALLATCQIQTKKWSDALSTIQRYLTEYPQGKPVEELSFWKGVAEFQEKNLDAAQTSLTAFTQKFPNSDKTFDARRMLGVVLLTSQKFPEAAQVFAKLATEAKGSLQGQAKVLNLYALTQAHDWPAALEVVKAMDPRMPEFDLVASFHLLTLKLGTALLEQEKPREALFAFQKVWPRDRIVARQQQRLVVLEKEEKRLGIGLQSLARQMQAREVVGQVKRELETLQKLPDYDTALRMRIAQSFFKLKRFRESALVLADTMKRMPPSALVESASVQLAACFAEMQRWEELIAASDTFVQKFPASKFLPQMLYFKGEANQRRNDFRGAVAAYEELLTKFPAFASADRVNFLIGYNLLMVDDNAKGIERFQKFQKDFPQSALREQSFYWIGMAYSFAKDYETCRTAMTDYLKVYPTGFYKGEAIFRRAHSLYSQQKFAEAIPELKAFLKDFNGHAKMDEALLLLGDCHFAVAEIDQGIDAFQRVSKTTPRFFEQAFFQIGKAYKLTEQPDKELAHYQVFVKDNGTSNRVVEALNHIARIYRTQEKEDLARNLYWESIVKYGNDPANQAVDDMFMGLNKLYKGDEEKVKLLAKLSDLGEEAEGKKQKTLAARAYWIRGVILRKPEPEKAQKMFLTGAKLVAPEEITARILADFSNAQREAGQLAEAKAAYEGLLMWHPRSMQKDQAYAGLGLIAVKEGKPKAALDLFEDFERETIQSPLLLSVLRAKVDILMERGQHKDAIVELEKILKIPSAKGKPWVIALNQIGDAYMALGKPDKAVPYYQRIYVMYGRWSDYVAKAYWQSGQAFEKLNMRQEALNTYKEFTDNAELAALPEYPKAKERLAKLGNAT